MPALATADIIYDPKQGVVAEKMEDLVGRLPNLVAYGLNNEHKVKGALESLAYDVVPKEKITASCRVVDSEFVGPVLPVEIRVTIGQSFGRNMDTVCLIIARYVNQQGHWISDELKSLSYIVLLYDGDRSSRRPIVRRRIPLP